MLYMNTSIAAVVGALSFITYFHHGEHHRHGATYFISFLLACVCSTASLHWILTYTLAGAINTTIWNAASFFFGLYSSCLLYRTSSFHPLQRIPGPFGAKISSLWFSFQVLKRQQAHLAVLDLHRKYGKIVRVGSNDLSIIHPKAVEKIHGPSSKCRKAAFYDLNHPVTSIQTTRDKVLHDQRRRLWSTAFTETMLRGYESRIKAIHRQLLARVDHDSRDESGEMKKPINVTRLINHYAFDVMGEVAYGTHFDMLTTGESHKAVDLLNQTMALMGFMCPIWLIRFAVEVPGLTSKWWEFVGYCFGQMEKCRSTKMEMPIIASSLLGAYRYREPTLAEKNVLQGEAQLLVVAGSDTTSAALTCALYELARNCTIADQLREAVSTSMRSYGETDLRSQHVQNLEILNGIINETLRLYPPVPTTLWRLTPAEGLWVDDETYIPGNVTVSTPQYVLGRSNDFYEEPDSFIPERWYRRPEMIKQDKVFVPFNIGQYSCVGRPLAMLNLRLTLAQLVHTYDFGFPSTTTTEEARLNMETGMKDTFTLMPGQLNLVFKRRA